MGCDPEGYPERTPRYMYMFIHNVYANFFKDALDYFSCHLYPRFQYTVIGTYDKGVQYIIDKCKKDGQETDRPMLPALILNPSGDFDLADANTTGKQLWRFPNLAPGLVKRLFEPVYRDEQVLITVGFIRIQGDIELLMLLNSFYEYCDVRMLFLQIFAGYERWIYPQYFNTFIILPEELVNYTYTNEATGLTYGLDWDKYGAFDKIVKSIGKQELVLPVEVKPIYKLTGFGDASNRYGGADRMSDWRLTATIHYEIEIPAFLVLETDWIFENISVNINAGSAYSEYSFNVPDSISVKEASKDSQFPSPDDDSTASIECIESDYNEWVLKTRYVYRVTQSDIDSTSDLTIQLPFSITNINELYLNSKYGEMAYFDNYVLENNDTIVINEDNVELEVDMLIEIYIYEEA
jgi:hypothetical protein